MADKSDQVRKAFEKFQEEGNRIFYPDRVTGWLFQHIGLVALAPLGLLLATDAATAAIGRGLLPNLWRDTFSDSFYVSATFVFLLSGMLFRNLIKQAPDLFTALAANGCLLENPEAGESPWKDFAACLKSRIRGPWRWTMIGVVIVVVLIYVIAWGLPGRVQREILHQNVLDGAYLVIKIMATPLLLGCVGAAAAWVLATLGYAITNLTPAFKLNIAPSHPDNSGGLGRLGVLALNMMIPLSLGVILFSFWSVFDCNGYTCVLSLRYQGLWQFFMMSGAIIAVSAALFAFFAPLWDIHVDMMAERRQFQDTIARQMAEAEDRLREHLERTETSDTMLQKLLDRRKALLELASTARDYPTWPFDARRIFLPIVSLNVLPPMVSIALQLISNA